MGTTNKETTQAEAPAASPSPRKANPIHVIEAARATAAAGGTIAQALALLQATHPGLYDQADGDWFSGRLTYYRENNDYKRLVPSFGTGMKSSSAAIARAILDAEKAKNGGKLLIPVEEAGAESEGGGQS